MAAPTWQLAVENYIESDSTDISTVAKGLQSKDPSLLQLIEYLGKYLTSENVTTRGCVIKLISEVLHQIPGDLLSAEEVKLLVTYFCERLVDHHSIQPHALSGILALTVFKHLPEGCAEAICHGIFRNVQTQTLAQGDRKVVYTIFLNLLNTRLKELQKMEAEFVLGYLQAMDAEKDPRNLILAFDCARTVITNFPLGVFMEDMFEVVSCYFPVDFNPPANDPHGVTRDDLILGLRSCLTASPKFGPLCIPLLLEKLSSDIQSAKLDSLQTLSAAAPVYSTECLQEFQGSLFRCIKQEVFSSGNPQLEEVALSALTSMSKALSPQTGVSAADADVDDLIKEVFQDIGRHLKDDELRLFAPSCRLLRALQSGSGYACSVILNKILPLMTDLYNKHSIVTQRKKILEMFLSFLECSKSFSDTKVEKTLTDHKPSILPIVLSAVSDANQSLAAVAVKGLAVILSIPQLNSADDRVVILSLLSDMAFSDSSDIRTSCEEPIRVLASVDNGLVQRKLIPGLFCKIKSDQMEVDGVNSNTHDAVYNLLVLVTCTSGILKEVTETLSSHLHTLSQENCETDKSVLQKAVSTSKCLCNIVQNSVRTEEHLDFLYKYTVPEVYRLLVRSFVSSYKDVCCMCHCDVVVSMETLVREIMCNTNPERCREMCTKVDSLFLQGDTSVFSISTDKAVDKWSPLEYSSPWQQTQLASLVMPVICSCPKQISLPNIDKYVKKLTELSLRSEHELTRDKSTKCLAGLVNKYPAGDSLSSFLSDRCRVYDTTMNSTQTEDRLQFLNQWIWITKALILRGHADGRLFFTKLLDTLNDEVVGERATKGVEIILSDSSDVLNKPMHANIRMMYKQRLFTENIQSLVQGFHQAKQNTKKNYLMALSYMLKTLPKQVLVTELPPLFPLLVQSLLCDNLDLQVSTMATLFDLITDAPEIITQQIDSVIIQLLKLSHYQDSMKVRIGAMKCLDKLSSLPEPIVLPYRTKVIKDLEPRLDDKKRLARREAVQARCSWFLLGQPGK